MIWGIGIDIVDTKEFQRLLNLNRKNFLDLILTEKEKSQANSDKTLTGIFSAKEAVFKCLNLSASEIKDFNYFKEIEITHLSYGKPEAKFLYSLARKFPKEKFKVFVSISYNSHSTTSIAVIETPPR